MTYSILRKLNKKAYPDGRLNFKYLNCKAGIKGYNESQVRDTAGIYTTPWICERGCSLVEYNNKMYGMVDKALEKVFHTVASECKELELLIPQKVPTNLDKENYERMAASVGSSISAMDKRRTEILIHLSELRTDMETIDAALQHHLEKAENVVRKHVLDYWAGVLKASANHELPEQPDFNMPEIQGKKVYEKHLDNMKKLLDKALKEYDEEV